MATYVVDLGVFDCKRKEWMVNLPVNISLSRYRTIEPTANLG